MDKVTVHFDPGCEVAAFELLRQVLPGLRELDRHVRLAAADLVVRQPDTA